MIEKPVIAKEKKQHLCFYDIENNLIRSRLVKFLKKFGVRIQKSVFIIFITKKEKKKIFDYFNKIKEKNDKIGIVYLCSNCFCKIEHLPKIKLKNFYII